MNQTQNVTYVVNDWRVEPHLLTITRADKKVTLEPRVMDLLIYLCEHQGEVLTRDDLVQQVWHSVVTDNAVSRAIAILRKALEDDKVKPRYIATIPTRGYRFIAPVKKEIIELEEPVASKPEPAPAEQSTESAPIVTSQQSKSSSLKPILLGMLLLTVAILSVLLIKARLAMDSSEPLIRLGVAKPLTTLTGSENDPSFSPDGSQLAFVHRAPDASYWQLYVKHLDTGVVSKVTSSNSNDRSPDWSPDGRRLIFHRSGDGRCTIMQYDLVQQAESLIVECNPSSSSSDVSWGRDENTIYFTDGESSLSPYKIYQYSLSTGKKRQMTNPTNSGRGDYRLHLSPDGKQIVFLRDARLDSNQIWSLDVETLETQEVLKVTRVLHDIAWDGDGQRLFFVGDDGQISTLALDTREQSSSLSSTADELGSPAISPRGDLLAVVSGALFQADIWSLDMHPPDIWSQNTQPNAAISSKPPPVGYSLRPFIESSRRESIPRMDHAGNNVAFISNRNGLTQIWLKHGDQLEEQLTAFEKLVRILHIDWSPDNTSLLYAVNGDLQQIDISSKEVTSIPTDLGFVSNPVWAADGASIYLASEADGDWQIWQLNLADQSTRRLTTNGGFLVRDAASRNGIFFSKYRASGIWFLPFNGDQEQLVVDNFTPDRNYYDWYLVGDYIYYSIPSNPDDPHKGTTILRYDLNQRTTQTIYATERPVWFDFSLSKDANSLLLTRTFRTESKIIEFPITHD